MATSYLVLSRTTWRRTLVSLEALGLSALGADVAKAVVWGQRQRIRMRTSTPRISGRHIRSKGPADPRDGNIRPGASLGRFVDVCEPRSDYRPLGLIPSRPSSWLETSYSLGYRSTVFLMLSICSLCSSVRSSYTSSIIFLNAGFFSFSACR